MPHIDVNGARLHYDIRGDGPETILFSHGLLFSGDMFAAQVQALADRYRCVTYDHRGQGRSSVTADGYDIDTVSEDCSALIEALDLAPCHFVGLSMGGFVGMRLAIRRPELLRSLTLVDTTAEPEPAEMLPRYRTLNVVARWLGLRVVASRVMPIMFGQSFLNDPTRATERDAWRGRIVAADRLGITRAVRGVIERDDVADAIKDIDLPVLIVVGDEDVATTPDKSHRMHAAIRGSKLVTIPQAGHSSTIEQPEALNRAIADFLAGIDVATTQPAAATT